MLTDLEFMSMVYGEFRTTRQWPSTRSLQSRLRAYGNLKLRSAKIGWERIVYEEKDDGVCFLRLAGLAELTEAADDVEAFLAVMRDLAGRFVTNGVTPVPFATIVERLALSTEAAERIADILRRDAYSRATWQATETGPVIVPRDDIFYFEHVASFDDYMATAKKAAEEALEASQIGWRRYGVGNPSHALAEATPTSGEPAKEPTLSRKELVEAFETLLVARATGGESDDRRYKELRQQLLNDSVVAPLLPSYIKTCRTASQFWSFIKKTSQYQPRRERIWDDFGAILRAIDGAAPADAAIGAALTALDPNAVRAIWETALARRANDPEAAITTARTLLESTCKFILDAADVSYEQKDDLPQLYRQTAKLLKLAPDQHSESLFKQVLGGCFSVVEGLGAIRNKLSDAHGKGRGAAKPAPRHAELAVNLAGAMSMFLVETWLAREKASK